jgi:hypothetical protein
MLNSNLYETTSLVRAAFLEVRLGVSCEIRFNKPKEAVFIFHRTDDVVAAVGAFEGDGEIPARRYSRAIGVLRDRLWGLRQGITNVENVNGSNSTNVAQKNP